MDKILERSLLYDFYGELLTDHQKKIYEQVVLDDYSLGEVAEDTGISRQGVHDLVKRTTKTLEDYENRLHMVERFVRIREQVGEMTGLLNSIKTDDQETIDKIRSISGRIIEEL